MRRFKNWLHRVLFPDKAKQLTNLYADISEILWEREQIKTVVTEETLENFRTLHKEYLRYLGPTYVITIEDEIPGDLLHSLRAQLIEDKENYDRCIRRLFKDLYND